MIVQGSNSGEVAELMDRDKVGDNNSYNKILILYREKKMVPVAAIFRLISSFLRYGHIVMYTLNSW